MYFAYALIVLQRFKLKLINQLKLINSLLYIQDLKLNYKQERREREHLHAYFSRSNV